MPDYEEGMRLLREALLNVGQTAQQAVQQLTESVGSANFQNEGEEMPEITGEVVSLNVAHTGTSRGNAFGQLGLQNLLVSGLDEENWIKHLKMLRESLGNITWDVEKGSFTMRDNPHLIGPDGTKSPVSEVTVTDAQAFLDAASNGRLGLEQQEGFDSRWVLTPSSSLERAAWVSYIGTQSYISSVPDSDSEAELIPVTALKTHMQAYSEFNSSADRRRYIQNALRNRMRESSEFKVTRTESNWDTAAIRRFSSFFEKLRRNLVVEQNSLSQLPILPKKTLSSRPWGIEVEAVDIGGVETPEHWELKDDGSLRSLYSSCLPPRVTDPQFNGPAVPRRTDHDEECMSLEYEDEDCSCGYWDDQETGYHPNESRGDETSTGEWNSPVLRSFHSRGLKHICDAIEFRNTNNSAGIHVHISAHDLTPEQVVRLSVIYSALEPLFEAEYKRGETRTYCQTVGVNELIYRFKALQKLKKSGGELKNMDASDRYFTVNLMALRSHGTIEFRAMGPVYNYEHLVRWAYLLRELVNVAKANVPQSEWTKVRTMKDLVTLFSKFGKETPTPEWATDEPAEDLIAKIIGKLGSENRRIPHVQPLESNPQYSIVNDDYSQVATLVRAGRTRW